MHATLHGVPRRTDPRSTPRTAPVAQPTPSALARDRELLARWRAGDTEAGAELLGHYERLVWSSCTRLGVRREDEILEIWHDLVVRLMQRLPTLADAVKTSFAGYLAWQVRDLVGARRRRQAPAASPPEATADPSPSVEIWDAVQHCWQRLPAGEHRVFELRYVHGLSLAEVAAEIGSNANAVAQSVFRLSRRMRACLRAQGISMEDEHG